LRLRAVLDELGVGNQKAILDEAVDYGTEMCKQLINYAGVLAPGVVMGYGFPRSAGIPVNLYVCFVNPAS
jgi:hypothetical protein